MNDKNMKSYVVHVSRGYHRPYTIVGETVPEAVQSQIKALSSACSANEHYQKDVELVSCEYNKRILGGQGGWEAKFVYIDLVTNAPAMSSAWIYADENGNPKQSRY